MLSHLRHTLRDRWRELKAGTPGERFQERYRSRQQDGRGTWRKLLFVGGGILVMAAGVFFLPAPGPGMLILLVGAGMVAQESRHAARALDWAEVRLRALTAASVGLWRRSPPAGKALLLLLAAALAGGVVFGAYQLVFAR